MKRIVLLLAASTGCVPDLADETPTVSAPRLLATRVEPPEARPGTSIATASLWAGSDGAIADAPLTWSFCTARKALAEPGTIAAACLAAEGPELIAIGYGPTAAGTLPAEACRLFGPDRPDPKPGETISRPTDPDATGGYYQPIQVLADGDVALASARIRCGLPEATPDQAQQFLGDYVANTNPAIASVTRAGQGELTPLERDAAAVAIVDAGETLELSAAWPACDAPPCSGAERYLWFDPTARTLVSRREAMRVSWFATAGSFETSHAGRAESDLEARADNRWTAPASGTVHLWVVLRDDRGGATWASFRIAVR